MLIFTLMLMLVFVFFLAGIFFAASVLLVMLKWGAVLALVLIGIKLIMDLLK